MVELFAEVEKPGRVVSEVPLELQGETPRNLESEVQGRV